MNLEFKALEKRYGTLLAHNIAAEIMRVDQKKFSFYRAPEALKGMKELCAELEKNESGLLAEKGKVA